MYKAILEVDGKAYSLIGVHANTYNRGSKYEPHPNDKTLQLQIKLFNMDQSLWDWVSDDSIQKKNGQIKIMDMDTGRVSQIITFVEAFSSSYNMTCQLNDYSQCNITLSSSKIEIRVHEGTVPPASAKSEGRHSPPEL